MALDILIGAQWGDEGKAKVVDYLSKDFDIIVRYQGGANAGHTVIYQGRKFVFHLIPSGILHPQKLCVIGNGVVLDPEEFFKEIQMLEENSIDYYGRIKVSQLAHLIFPYHKILDSLKENSSKNKIGTTGRGIGPCYADKFARNGIRVTDLYEKSFEEKLSNNLEYVNFLITHYHSAKPIDKQAVLEDYLVFAEKLKPFLADTPYLLNQALKSQKNILAEGAQGAGLDIDFGTYPFVTSSHPTVGGAITGTGTNPLFIRKIYGIFKAYMTRVGEGPFPTEADEKMSNYLRTKGHEYGATTGRPRRCGWFDLVFARYSAMINGLTDIVLTKLDVLDGLSSIYVCKGYRYKNSVIKEFVPHLENVEPVYMELKGWDKTQGITDYHKLPDNAKRYIELLEKEIETTISIVSVGPDREETLLR